MLYRFLISYARLKLLRIVLNRVLGSKFVKTKGKKSMQTMDLVTYALEFLATYYLSGKRKVKVK